MTIKITFISFFFTFLVHSANAQAADYFQSSNKILVVKPSLNSSSVNVKVPGSGSSSTDARPGYGIGIEVWQKIAKTFYVSAGLHYNSFGYKDVRTNYLNIPLVFNYLSKGQMITLGAGVYGGYGLSGKYKNSLGSRTKIKFGEGATDNRSHIDAGIVINAGYNLFTLGHFTSYAYIGLKDLTSKARQNGTTMKMLSWVLSYAIPLTGISKKK